MMLLVATSFYLWLYQTSKNPTSCEGCSRTGGTAFYTWTFWGFFPNASSLRQKALLALSGSDLPAVFVGSRQGFDHKAFPLVETICKVLVFAWLKVLRALRGIRRGVWGENRQSKEGLWGWILAVPAVHGKLIWSHWAQWHQTHTKRNGKHRACQLSPQHYLHSGLLKDSQEIPAEKQARLQQSWGIISTTSNFQGFPAQM